MGNSSISCSINGVALYSFAPCCRADELDSLCVTLLRKPFSRFLVYITTDTWYIVLWIVFVRFFTMYGARLLCVLINELILVFFVLYMKWLYILLLVQKNLVPFAENPVLGFYITTHTWYIVLWIVLVRFFTMVSLLVSCA